MKLKNLNNMPVNVYATVADGSLVHLDEISDVETTVGRKLNWEEVEDSRSESGRYFTVTYKTVLPFHEAKVFD